MEFISQKQEDGLNCYVVASFMEIFIKAKFYKNEKWIKILGNLMETNLTEDWKNDRCESQLMDQYIFRITMYYTSMMHKP